MQGKSHEDFKCQKLSVDTWEEKVDMESDNINIVDCYTGEDEMEEVEDEKYLGDIISKDGKNLKNIKARVNKRKGIVARIMSLLDGIPFGKYCFEVAVILRNSLLVSSLLCNSEAWYNVSNSELNYLESVDLMFLRSVLKAPKSTPKEMLFLELGCIPLRDIIQKRRLSFLQYILQEDETSMMYRFLEAQMKTKHPKDWANTVIKDFEELKLNLTFAEIKKMKKNTFKTILRQSIEVNTLKKLNSIKEGHSKVKQLQHKTSQMRKYFKPNSENPSKEIVQLIFKLRCKVTDSKLNYKGLYDNLECEACGIEK